VINDDKDGYLNLRLAVIIGDGVRLNAAQTAAILSRIDALVAEVERLRDEADLLRAGLEATRAYADRAESEALSLRGERATVVAWLLARAEETANRRPGNENEISLTYSLAADFIERGEHRREEKP
jgi:hypothetical protein